MALTFPTSPTNGQIFTDTTTGNRYIYVSASGLWKFASNSVGMSVSSTPPSNVAPGAMWFNREIGRTFVYYDDGDSKQWIETVPAGAVDTNTIAGYVNPVFASMNGAYTTANAGFGVANVGFGKANTALQNTSGTFAGSLSLTGNIALGGIATSSIPFQSGCDSGGTALQLRGRPSSNDAAIRWYSNDGVTQQGYVQFGGQAEFTVVGSNDFIVKSNNTTRMFFNGTSGNIGIGTTSPSTKLHVSTGTSGGFALFEGSSRKLYLEDSGDSVRLSTEGTGPFAVRAAGSGGNHLSIDTSGYVTMPNQPGFAARRLSSQSGSAYWTHDTVDFNIGSCWNGTTARFTCPIAGRYLVITRFMNTANYGVRLFKNGSYTGYQLAYEQTNPGWQGSYGSAVVQCSASDYLQIYLDSAVYGDSTSYNHVCISLLS